MYFWHKLISTFLGIPSICLDFIITARVVAIDSSVVWHSFGEFSHPLLLIMSALISSDFIFLTSDKISDLESKVQMDSLCFKVFWQPSIRVRESIRTHTHGVGEKRSKQKLFKGAKNTQPCFIPQGFNWAFYSSYGTMQCNGALNHLLFLIIA